MSSICTSGHCGAGNSSGCSPYFLTAFPACVASLCFSFGVRSPFFHSFFCLHCFSPGDCKDLRVHLQLSPPSSLWPEALFIFFALDPISLGQNMVHQLLIPVFNHLPLTKKNLDIKSIPSFFLFVTVLLKFAVGPFQAKTMPLYGKDTTERIKYLLYLRISTYSLEFTGCLN